MPSLPRHLDIRDCPEEPFKAIQLPNKSDLNKLANKQEIFTKDEEKLLKLCQEKWLDITVLPKFLEAVKLELLTNPAKKLAKFDIEAYTGCIGLDGAYVAKTSATYIEMSKLDLVTHIDTYWIMPAEGPRQIGYCNTILTISW